MTIQTLAHTDSLEQLAACEEYSRFELEQEALTRFRMEFEFAEVDDAEGYDSLEDQLSH